MLALSVTPGRFSSCSSNGPHPSPHTPTPPPHGGGGGGGRGARDHMVRRLAFPVVITESDGITKNVGDPK